MRALGGFEPGLCNFQQVPHLIGGFSSGGGDGAAATVFSFGCPGFNFSVGDRHRGEDATDGVGEGGVSDKDKRRNVTHSARVFLLDAFRESCGTPETSR